MAFLIKLVGNVFPHLLVEGKSYIKALETDNEDEANQIKQDAEEQLARIRKEKSALASKLLADGHPIFDVLFGSPEIGHLLAKPSDDNPLTLSELRDAFIDHLLSTDHLSSSGRGKRRSTGGSGGPPRAGFDR